MSAEAITPSDADAPADLSGVVLDGRYRLVEPIKAGGMGLVYRAEQLRLSRSVAVKVLHAGTDARARERFRQEAEALGQLDHPSIARVFDFGWTEEAQPYLVVEWIDGHDLREHLAARGALPWRLVCEIGAQIADGLSVAHAAGWIHRDLKPSNVMLEGPDAAPRVRVLDFGVAKAIARTPAVAITQPGDVLGTPGYMAPEQVMGGEVDHTVDLYALGIVLAEMLGGRRLFTEDRALELALRERVPLPKGPRELIRLIEELLSASPRARPADAARVAARLRRLARRPRLRLMVAGGVALATVLLGAFALVASIEPPARPSIVVELPPVPASPRPSAEPSAPVAPGRATPDERLLHGSGPERRAAAREALARGELDDVTDALARLELASSCEAKRRQVVRLGRSGDARVRPVLERLRDRPRSGCGLLGLRDCLSCLRDALGPALRAVSAARFVGDKL